MKPIQRNTRSAPLSGLHQTALYVSFSVLFLSGLFWTIDPKRAFWLAIHGGAAMAGLIVLGSILPVHVRRFWTLKRNRGNGLLFLGVNAFLIVTGYGLYYAGNDTLRAWLSRWHGWIGFAFPLILAAHIIWGRQSRRPAEKCRERRHPGG